MIFLLHLCLRQSQRLSDDRLQYIRHLQEAHGIHLTAEEEAWLYAQKNPGKPHLGQILLRQGLGNGPDDMIGVLRQYINPFKGGNDRTPVETAIRAIHHAGGVAIWAHPLGGEGHRHKPPEVFAPLLRDLMEAGIEGMECWYSRYNAGEIAFLKEQAKLHGLLISGGSDFHGSPKPGLLPGTLSVDGDAPEVWELTMVGHMQG